MSLAQGSIIFGRPLQAIVRHCIRSSNSHQLYVQRYRHTMFGRRAFSVAGTTAWNTLPDNLRDPALPPHTFRAGLKTLLQALILLAYQRIRDSATMRYINLRLTLTLTLTKQTTMLSSSEAVHTSFTSLSNVAGRTVTLIKTGSDGLAQPAVQTASSIAENVGRNK